MDSNTEVAFSLSLRRRGLHSMAFVDDDSRESEVSGSLGEVCQMTVLDGVLIEVRGSRGTLRISLPSRYLELFEKQSSNRRDG